MARLRSAPCACLGSRQDRVTDYVNRKCVSRRLQRHDFAHSGNSRIGGREGIHAARSDVSISRCAIRVRFQRGENGVMCRRRDAVPAAKFDDLAGEPGQFEAVAARQIDRHRGPAGRRRTSDHRDLGFDHVAGSATPFGAAHRLGLPRQVLEQREYVGVIAQFADRQAGDRGAAAHRRQKDEFLPDRHGDVLAEQDLEAGGLAQRAKRLGARGERGRRARRTSAP